MPRGSSVIYLLIRITGPNPEKPFRRTLVLLHQADSPIPPVSSERGEPGVVRLEAASHLFCVGLLRWTAISRFDVLPSSYDNTNSNAASTAIPSWVAFVRNSLKSGNSTPSRLLADFPSSAS